MSNTLQIRRGTKAALDLITLAAGELGWTSDTEGLYIGDGANNKLYATEYIDWSATGAEDIHGDRLSGVLLADGTVPLTANWNLGNFKIGINTVPAYPVHLRTLASDESTRGIYLYDTPLGTHTATRYIYGMYLHIYSTADEDTYSSRIYGLNIKVDSTAEIDQLYGTYSVINHTSPDTISTLAAQYGMGRVEEGSVSFIYGAHNLVYVATSGNAASAYGAKNNVQMSATGQNITTAYGTHSGVTQTAGTLNTAYLYYGVFSGTMTTKWGIYLTGETKNYFSGMVGIGQSNVLSPLHIQTSPTDETLNQVYLHLMPSGTHTAARTIKGLNQYILSTANDGGFNSTLMGIDSYLQVTGDIPTVSGGEFEIWYANAAGVSLLHGLKTYVTVAAGSASTCYASRNEFVVSGTGSASIVEGLRASVQMNSSGGTLNTAFGVRSVITQTNGTLTNAYLFYGQMSGTVTTNWGLYLTGEGKNYLSGHLLIGTSSDEAELTVLGDVALLNTGETRELASAFNTDSLVYWWYNGAGWYLPFWIADTKAHLLSDGMDFSNGWIGAPGGKFMALEAGSGGEINEFSTDGTLAGDSDSAVPTEKAVKTYVDAAASDGEVTHAVIETGTYTGDGELSQVISLTRSGITPKIVMVWPHITTPTGYAGVIADYWRMDQMAAGYCGWDSGTYRGIYDNMIIAMAQGSFTVDDAGADGHPNKDGYSYDYLVMGDETTSLVGNVLDYESTLAVVETGTYTGDGSLSKVVSLADSNIVIKALWITPDIDAALDSDNCRVYYREAEMADNRSMNHVAAGGHLAKRNQIIAFATGSFTVDDDATDSHPNKLSQGYDYVVVGTKQVTACSIVPKSRVSAYLGTSQTGVVSGTWTKVELDTEDFDELGEFDPTTNHRFTPDQNGYYQVSVSLKHDGMQDGQGVGVAIYKNGVVEADTHFDLGDNVTARINTSKMLYLTTSDYIELWGRHYLGTNGTFGAGRAYTYMTIHRLS